MTKRKWLIYFAASSALFLITAFVSRILLFVPVDWLGAAFSAFFFIGISVLMVRWTKSPMFFPVVAVFWSIVLYIIMVVGFLGGLSDISTYEPVGGFDEFMMNFISVSGYIILFVVILVGIIAAFAVFILTTVSSLIAHACFTHAEKRKAQLEAVLPIEGSCIEVTDSDAT